MLFRSLNPDPIGVAQAIHLSRAITRRIHQTLFWAFAYNAVGIPLAMLGLLNPVLAGGAMALSSVSVIASALMLGRGRLRFRWILIAFVGLRRMFNCKSNSSLN